MFCLYNIVPILKTDIIQKVNKGFEKLFDMIIHYDFNDPQKKNKHILIKGTN